MNILITGAGGQLGCALRKISAGYDHNCIFTDVVEGENMIALDATDSEAVRTLMKKHDVDVIVNCAGYTDVGRAEDDLEKARIINAELPAVLASAAKGAEAVMIHISTDYVFDGKANTPYRETDATGPQGVYARTKLEGELAVSGSGCRHIILRTAWMYSCFGKNFFRTVEKKASESAAMSVVCDQAGTPTYAIDLAQAIFWIIDDGKLNHTGIYHYSNEGVCSWYDFAKAINRGLGYTCDIRPCRTDEYPSKVSRPAYSVLDKSLFKETFGYDIPHWEDSLLLCINEFQTDAR